MLSMQEAKDKAGQVFIEIYGEKFVRENIKRLTVGETDDVFGSNKHNKNAVYSFGIFKKNIDEYKSAVQEDGSILNRESEFAKHLADIKVNRKDGTVDIVRYDE